MMPKEIQEFIATLPPATINNSRAIVRADWARAEKMSAVSAARFLNAKYGWGLDPDRTAEDYGGEPLKNEYD